MSSSSSSLKDLGRLLEAEFHYTYKNNNGQQITINVGEEYILIKKSNVDWWQVIKSDQKKPFYVPAAYMKELDKQVFPDHAFFKKAYSKLQKDRMKHRSSDNAPLETERQSPVLTKQENYSHGSRENLSDLSSKSKYSLLRASCDSLDRFIENENPYDEVPFESKVSMPSQYNVAKEFSSKMREDPEYENLENIQSRIAESRLQISPATERKESKTLNQSHEQQSISESVPHNVVVYANTANTGSQTRIPNEQSSSTTLEVQDDGWELQLDDQSNSKYYLNKRTGEMRVKPPRRSADSPTASTKPLIKNIPATKIVPPAPPDVSKKPKMLKTTVSPQLAEPLSPLERRKTSPARLDGNSDLPEVIDDGQDKPIESTAVEFSKSKSLKPSHIEPLKDKSSDSGVERHFSLKDRFFPDSDKKKHKHKKANSVSVSHSLSKSPLSSPDTSPKVSKDIIVPSKRPFSGWITERNQDGSVIYIRESNGERWQQMLDKSSGNFYYFNELNHETSWLLPELEPRDDTSFPVDIAKAEVVEDDLALIKKSGHLYDSRNRKASTIERDTMPPSSKEVIMPHSASLPFDSVPPKVSVKPRSFKSHAQRVMMAQSMIILPESRSNRLPYEDSPQFDKSRLQHEFEHSSPLPLPLIERKGRLNWTKLMEAGKKQRKNWIQQWVVIIANNLLFYKDEKQATMTKSSPHGKPDSSCDLRGATVDWTNDKSSKKNVIELQTVRGLSLLLQHDDHSTIEKWLKVIKATIERAVSATAML